MSFIFNQLISLNSATPIRVFLSKTWRSYFEKPVVFLESIFLDYGTMQFKRSQKRAGSSRYIVVAEAACLRIYFVYKKNLSLDLILLRTCNVIDSPDKDSSRMQPK